MAIYFVHWPTSATTHTMDLIRASREVCEDCHGGGFVLDKDGMRPTTGRHYELDKIFAIELRRSVADFAEYPDDVLFRMFETVKMVKLEDFDRSEIDSLCKLLGGKHTVKIECDDVFVTSEILRDRMRYQSFMRRAYVLGLE